MPEDITFIFASGRITHRGKSVTVDPIRMELFEILMDHPDGIGTVALYDELYMERGYGHNGNVVSAHIYEMRRQLRPIGLDITSRKKDGKRRRHAFYRIVKLHEELEAAE